MEKTTDLQKVYKYVTLCYNMKKKGVNGFGYSCNFPISLKPLTSDNLYCNSFGITTNNHQKPSMVIGS